MPFFLCANHILASSSSPQDNFVTSFTHITMWYRPMLSMTMSWGTARACRLLRLPSSYMLDEYAFMPEPPLSCIDIIIGKWGFSWRSYAISLLASCFIALFHRAFCFPPIFFVHPCSFVEPTDAQMPEEDAFALFVKVMYDYGLRNLYTSSFADLHLMLYQVSWRNCILLLNEAIMQCI